MLAEVGERGQTRLAEATAHVPAGGLTGEVASLYLQRAGFANVAADGEPIAAPSFVEDASARAIVAGALVAMREFREHGVVR